MLSGKNIILGVTGSIAAYKAAFLVRLFIKAKANVKVIMTSVASDFITPLTLSVLSKNPVLSEFTSEITTQPGPQGGEWNNHVDLGQWADLMIIAPVTANTMAKMANGICDNLLLAAYLSIPVKSIPVFFAPAMDMDMYKHPSTANNIKKLQSYGNILIAPDEGELASGLTGEGRMTEPETIFKIISEYFSTGIQGKGTLTGKKALVTAGPTHEAIDPVRFISNYSSGKMGFAVAEELAIKGAKVKLVCGPTQLISNHPNIYKIDVTSAEEMYSACVNNFSEMDITVMCAAVADYTPESVARQKIKKNRKNKSIKLTPTKDVLDELGKMKSVNQILVGFALETENELTNAKSKIKKKNLDLIVLNSLNDHGAGFSPLKPASPPAVQQYTNKITIIDKDNNTTRFELKSKTEVAKDIVDKIMEIQGIRYKV
ncbi:MAG: bifunctional phosphopantothenoylcysteine decarboxylase/phosphopantothenate--cysteine ligase CoaBC [Bacteroidota bacterium]